MVLQQGGSTCECYGNVYEAVWDAKAAVSTHEEASYKATYVEVMMEQAVTEAQAWNIAYAMADACTKFMELDLDLQWDAGGA